MRVIAAISSTRHAVALKARPLFAIGVLFVLCVQPVASPLHAQMVARISFDIPAQPLSTALIAFSRQSGIAVMAPARLVRGHAARAVVGSMTAEEALMLLCAGSPLVVSKNGASLYVIEPLASAGSRRRASRSEIANAGVVRTARTDRDRAGRSAAAGMGASEIVVTGSRIAVSDFHEPTPVTIVSAEVLQRDAKPTIGDTIRELPAVGLSSSPNNSVGAGGIVAGTAGLDTINLRQLGYLRTLVLFDGQRIVQSNITGQVDIGTIPTVLVERVDIVTAGASAAWGSDAVAGVVNLILNKKFSGVRANVDLGNSEAWDHRNYRAQLAVGTSFAGGQGHAIFTASRTESPEVLFAGRRRWNTYSALMENPAYTPANREPRYVHVDHVGLSQATTGGLITSGPLRGIQFIGPDATPASFNFGQVSGPLSAGGDAEQLNASLDNLTVSYNSTNLFGYSSYDFRDWLKASLQVNYGESVSRNSSVPVTRFGNLLIQADNAFLPAAIKARMQTLGLATIELGTTNLNNLPSGDFTIGDLEGTTVAIPTAVTRRRLKRGVLSFYGNLGGEWSWNAYYQYGTVRVRQDVLNNLIPSNFNQAIDAIVAPAGNQAGVAPGVILCRSTLTDPGNGCVPLNIFGTGVASAAGIAYVNVKPGQNYQIQSLTEKVFSVSLQGLLPIGLPAGDIAIATGIEHRDERGKVATDQGAQARLYSLGNFTPFFGRYAVTELFLETEIPLLVKGARSLSVNAAGRVTDYSTSGRVGTWKLGFTGQATQDVRFRATVSRDIRAPILNELFSLGIATSGSAVDPHSGQNVPIFTFRTGNAALKPETAQTYSVGMVVAPHRLPGLSVSLDYYKIVINDAIYTLTSQQVLARCAAGRAVFCDQLVFGGADGALNQINLFPLNINTDAVEGLDVQAVYRRPFLGGSFSARLLGNYVFRQSQDQFGVKVDYAGGIGPDNPVEGVPRARFNLDATLSRGPASVTAQIRFIGAAKLVNDWGAKDVDRNRVPPIAYVDLRGSWRLTDAVELYGAVDNLLNQDPPIVAGTSDQGQNVYYFTAIRGDIYDIIGRTYRLGLRARF